MSYLATKGAQYKGCACQARYRDTSTARYNEICGGAGLSVITSPQEREKTDVLVAISISIIKHYGCYPSRR